MDIPSIPLDDSIVFQLLQSHFLPLLGSCCASVVATTATWKFFQLDFYLDVVTQIDSSMESSTAWLVTVSRPSCLLGLRRAFPLSCSPPLLLLPRQANASLAAIVLVAVALESQGRAVGILDRAAIGTEFNLGGVWRKVGGGRGFCVESRVGRRWDSDVGPVRRRVVGGCSAAEYTRAFFGFRFMLVAAGFFVVGLAGPLHLKPLKAVEGLLQQLA
jgi:hypothetical protein